MAEQQTKAKTAAKGTAKKPERLVAVVVTYNRLEQLQPTLTRLLETPGDVLQAVMVIDNASTDDTQGWLAAQCDPRLVVERCDTNGGGAGGFDTGMRLAMARFDPDWLVVMDDDARPQPGALAAFQALHHDWDAVAAAVYFPSGSICEMNRPSRNPFWHWPEFWRTLRGGRGGFHLRPADYAATGGTAIDVTSFVGFFISRRAIARVGYPDRGLFLYGDDGLYTLGLSQAGGRIGFEPSVRFEHDCSTFQGGPERADGAAQRGRFRPLWKVYYYHRNLLLLYRLAAGWLFWPVLVPITLRWLLKVRDHPGERWLFLGLMGRALRDGLLRRTDVSHTRVTGWATGWVERR